jgi:hypothetical protein
VGRACSTNRGEEERIYVIGGEDQDVGGWIILGWYLERWDGVMWTGLVWLRKGTVGELL